MSVAHSYAKALYEAAVESSAPSGLTRFCDEIQSQLEQFLEIIESSREAEIALTAPIVTSKERARLVGDITAKMGLLPLVRHVLIVLASKGRLRLLEALREDFSATRLQAEGGVAGGLVSAETMTSEDIETLSSSFARKLGKRVVFKVSVDPGMLAGVKVTVNGVTYDGTLRAQVERLRNRVIVGAVSA